MKQVFDRREFSIGDQVLVLLPHVKTLYQATFFGPCNVLRKVSVQNYLVEMPNKRKDNKICHINLLKPYFAQVSSDEVYSVLLMNTSRAALEEDEKMSK